VTQRGRTEKKIHEWHEPELSRGTRHCTSRIKLVIDQRVFRNSSWKCQDNGLVPVASCRNACNFSFACPSSFLVYQQDSPATETIMQQCLNGIIQTCKLLLSLHCQGNTTGIRRNGTRSDGQAIVAVVKRKVMGLASSYPVYILGCCLCSTCPLRCRANHSREAVPRQI
jgi:hypothetical protein